MTLLQQVMPIFKKNDDVTIVNVTTDTDEEKQRNNSPFNKQSNYSHTKRYT